MPRASYALDVLTAYGPDVYYAQPAFDPSPLITLFVLGVLAVNMWASVIAIRVGRRYLSRTAARAGDVASAASPAGGARTSDTLSSLLTTRQIGVVVPALAIGAVGLVLTVLAFF